MRGSRQRYAKGANQTNIKKYQKISNFLGSLIFHEEKRVLFGLLFRASRNAIARYIGVESLPDAQWLSTT
jgi:hypothetical protein